MKSEIYALKETGAVKMNQISEKTRSKFLLLVCCLHNDGIVQNCLFFVTISSLILCRKSKL